VCAGEALAEKSVRAAGALASVRRIPGYIGRASFILLRSIAVIVPTAGGLGLELFLFLFLLGKLALAFFVSVIGSSQIDLSGRW
jgi:hypothetical protein